MEFQVTAKKMFLFYKVMFNIQFMTFGLGFLPQSLDLGQWEYSFDINVTFPPIMHHYSLLRSALHQ